MNMTFQEIRIIATGPCIANQLRDVNTICSHIVKIYKDKEVNKNVKNIFLSMCDVKVSDIYFTEFGTALMKAGGLAL
jgi:hypothetical protein